MNNVRIRIKGRFIYVCIREQRMFKMSYNLNNLNTIWKMLSK